MCSCGSSQCEGRSPEREQQLLDTVGWFAHYIVDGDYSPYHTNYHTHGLVENFNHKDIQFCVPANPKSLHMIATTIIDNIKNGVVYEPGEVYSDVLDDYQVKAILAVETDREVIRICFPDKEGNFEDGKLGMQFTMLNNNILNNVSEDE